MGTCLNGSHQHISIVELPLDGTQWIIVGLIAMIPLLVMLKMTWFALRRLPKTKKIVSHIRSPPRN